LAGSGKMLLSFAENATASYKGQLMFGGMVAIASPPSAFAVFAKVLLPYSQYAQFLPYHVICCRPLIGLAFVEQRILKLLMIFVFKLGYKKRKP
jgi:hypothetical protein